MYGDDEPKAYCRSFATTYVLILWLGADVNELELRRGVRDALRRIEQLTLALPKPPSDGPYSGALGKDRA
ncbi:MAG TPA: hypothetical protein VG755_24600 [Nannocystaceae bacterium]|nr:hypothetical protein [Nannocystaceae bacterium]